MDNKLIEILIENDEAYVVMDGEEVIFIAHEDSEALAYYKGYMKRCDSASAFVYRVLLNEMSIPS